MNGQPLTAETFARLYTEYQDAVFNYCLFRVGERQAAADLTADTFARAWQHRHRYDPALASYTTWLFAIARHRLIDRQRQEAQRTLVTLDGQYEDKTPLPEEQLVRTERLAHLRRLLKSLAEEQQQLIALKFGAGLTNRAIADLLGQSETAVGSAVHRAVQKLRQEWVEVGDWEIRDWRLETRD